MLKIKGRQRLLGTLVLCAVVFLCATRFEAKADAPDTDTSSQAGPTQGMTIHTEKGSKTLYTEALELTEGGNGAQKYTTVKRGDFVTTITATGRVVYPKQETIRYDFPYGVVYFLENTNTEFPIKEEGDVIARIYVEIDEIELASRERQLQRMEERGETGETYEELKTALEEMYAAVEQTEIVMKKAGFLLEQPQWRFGSQISSYSIVVADLGEQLIEVPNEGKQFRYGQEVKVTAQINGETREGKGVVISASANTISEELAGNVAYIRLEEESKELYTGSSISVTVETVHMEDVLLLDTSASYVENGNQMVKIKDEYGLHAVGFSFGRKGTSTYWIIDGLEEGAKILVQ
ncbi:MAG: hypothetical protein J1E35_03140 [Lachnospiraceae bacterium]|nr:hypothetical protein [Lachnospiraceae bacterium]